ncbi:hypothetical protein QBC47DRAFT_64681 [Echria macrotheca]|uniref:Uncharacterized protein n=1 Tax=Echria macrotheca TaxID=438768 RepID=A0AAJ0B5T8_9PEZI|nr:hypothetical protein QBC47DRAFT_64681 [Echria macrotheca]
MHAEFSLLGARLSVRVQLFALSPAGSARDLTGHSHPKTSAAVTAMAAVSACGPALSVTVKDTGKRIHSLQHPYIYVECCVCASRLVPFHRQYPVHTAKDNYGLGPATVPHFPHRMSGVFSVLS